MGGTLRKSKGMQAPPAQPQPAIPDTPAVPSYSNAEAKAKEDSQNRKKRMMAAGRESTMASTDSAVGTLNKLLGE